MANAGRVLILAKGAWVNTTNYSNLDLVTKGSTAYLARQSSIGVDPSTDSTYTYWQPFGSSATIATTSAPGLVMPDGTSITVDNTGLIKAALGVNDLTNVSISTLSDGQVLKYNSSTLKWENVSLGSAASKSTTNAVTQGSTALVESGAVYTETSSLNSALTNVQSDLTSINETGSTASRAISEGTYFYLNHVLVYAKTAIASGATFTLNTNYEVVTAGALNHVLNTNLAMVDISSQFKAQLTAVGATYLSPIMRKTIIRSMCYIQIYLSNISKSDSVLIKLTNIFDIIPNLSNLYDVQGIAASQHTTENCSGVWLDNTGLLIRLTEVGALAKGSVSLCYAIKE